ncbi:MAG: DNA repair protein RecO [Planctomycetes bacterium]|nr:DNA repair protein RecO [Planctomycetota bacterium]
MSRHESLAIVLRRWPYSESSQVVHLLTPHAGLVPALAKGSNKLQSGQAGVLDTYSLIRVYYSEKRDRDLRTLTRCELLDRFSSLSRRVDALNAAALLAELAELAAPPDTPSSEAYLFLVESLQALNQGAQGTSFLVPRLLRASELLGLQPDLGPATLTESAWFAVAAGRLLDPNESRPDGPAIRVTPSQHQWLRLAQSSPNEAPADPESKAEDCLTMLGQFLGYHLERPPRAWQAIEERRPALRAPR